MMQAIWPGFSAKRRSTGGEVVELGDERVLDGVHRHAGGGGHLGWAVVGAAEFGLGFHADQHRVMHAVIAAFHLDDLVAAGEAAGEADGVHRDLGAAGAEADLVHGEALADLVGEVELEGVRHAVHGSGLEALLDCFHHGGMAMAGHERAEAEVEVDVFVAVEIVDVGAFGVLDVERPGLIAAEVAGDAERHARLGFFQGFARRGSAGFISGEFFFQEGMHGLLSFWFECGCRDASGYLGPGHCKCGTRRRSTNDTRCGRSE